MLQDIKLENVRAIKMLIFLGCDPKVATIRKGVAVTNIILSYYKEIDTFR